MASLAIIASLVVLSVLFIGPITYLLSIVGLSAFIIYPLALLSIVSGIWFITIGLPIWYIGLIPIYCGYISILRTKKKQTQA
jgi:hypothetical protein